MKTILAFENFADATKVERLLRKKPEVCPKIENVLQKLVSPVKNTFQVTKKNKENQRERFCFLMNVSNKTQVENRLPGLLYCYCLFFSYKSPHKWAAECNDKP